MFIRNIIKTFLILTAVSIFWDTAYSAVDKSTLAQLQAARNGSLLKVISTTPGQGEKVSGNTLLKAKVSYDIPEFSVGEKYMLRIYTRGLSNKRAKKYYITSVDISSSKGSIELNIPLSPPIGKISSKEIGVDFTMAKKKRHSNALHILATITMKYQKSGATETGRGKSTYPGRRVDTNISTVSPKVNKEPVSIELTGLNMKNGSTILPGVDISGTLKYDIPGFSRTNRYLIYLYEITGGNQTLRKRLGMLKGSGSMPINYSYPAGSRGSGKLTLRFEVNRHTSRGYVPVYTYDAVTYTIGAHETVGGSWKEVHTELGDYYRFARAMTPMEIEGELYLHFYEEKHGIFLKKWTGTSWEDINLPDQIKKDPSNRPFFRYNNGSLYMSFLQYRRNDYHRWYLFKRDRLIWTQLGGPVTLTKFRWGIISDSFNFSPGGELFRIWSADYSSLIEKYSNGNWTKAGSLSSSAGYYQIIFDKDGKMLIGIGEPKGRPGVQAKIFKGGKFTDISAGLRWDKKDYINKYRFEDHDGRLYFTYRGALPRRGITVYEYSGGRWATVGETPVAYTMKGESGDGFGFTVHRGQPVIVYREAGMNFIPMVMAYDGKSWKPAGRPGFFSQNVSSPRVFSFKGKLYLFFTSRYKDTRDFRLFTYVYEE